jgi:hypothetical protein
VLGAGPYAVEASADCGLLKVRRADCESPTIRLSCLRSEPVASQGKLVFFRRAGRYFLAHAWRARSDRELIGFPLGSRARVLGEG